MSKTLLIVSAGIEAIPGIQRAKQMGLRVIVSDGNPQAPGIAEADHFLLADTYDPQATIAAVEAYQQEHTAIDGVMTIASDVPLTVASVAQHFSLPGIPISAAQLAADKLAMKQRFAADEVAIPWFSAVESSTHLRALMNEHDFPMVIKPVDSRGARGVARLTDDVDLDWAFQQAQAQSPTQRVMVEHYLDGPQVSTETLMINGKAYTPGFSDRNYEYLERFAPHIIENGGDLPSHLPQAIQTKVHTLVEQAALSMGIRQGVVKGDIVIHQEQAFVIELAARLSGGFFCSHEIPLNTGVDFVGCAIQNALGQTIDPAALTPKYQQPVVQRYIFPRPGKVSAVHVPEWIAQDADIPLLQVRAKVGDIISPTHSHPARAGVVIVTGKTHAAALDKAQQVIADIRIDTE